MGGCDEAGSERASLYQRLAGTGTWTIERLDGNIDYTSQLNERYPGGVNIVFEGGDGGGSYEIVSPRSGDSTEVLAAGFITLRRSNELEMSSGFGPLGPVTWTYRFEASRAIFSLRFGSRAFLRTLFWGGSQNLDLEMTIAPGDE